MFAVQFWKKPVGCSDAQVDADGDGVCDPGAPSYGPSACAGVDWCGEAPPGDFESLQVCLDTFIEVNDTISYFVTDILI